MCRNIAGASEECVTIMVLKLVRKLTGRLALYERHDIESSLIFRFMGL